MYTYTQTRKLAVICAQHTSATLQVVVVKVSFHYVLLFYTTLFYSCTMCCNTMPVFTNTVAGATSVMGHAVTRCHTINKTTTTTKTTRRHVMATTTRDGLGWTGGASTFQPLGMSSPVQTGAIHHSPTSLGRLEIGTSVTVQRPTTRSRTRPARSLCPCHTTSTHMTSTHFEPADLLLDDSRARHDVNKLHGVCDTSNVIGKV